MPVCLNGYPLKALLPYFDWDDLYRRWDLAGGVNAGRENARAVLRRDAENLLERIVSENLIELRGVVRFMPALSHNEDIMLYETGEPDGSAAPRLYARFTFPRSTRYRAGSPNPCLADFILPEEESRGRFDTLGLFALSAGFWTNAPSVDAETAAKTAQKPGDYNAILAASLADSLAEAWSAETHSRLAGSGIRPAFGYPCCPNHGDKRLAFKLLNAEKLCALSLTETAMISPAASVCGMYFLNPKSFYFTA
ncbi:MAG: hypothetical protein LBG72_01010 [Spirochaetaceae bacterium]|jgi:5-methyltetrahydrofolate--homocysteine methyltransferase|nr:hypothetical protein [Spirochaetaceae bacterium]